MTRRLMVASLAAVTAISLGGCASSIGDSDSSSSAGTKAPGEKVTLSFSSYAFQGPTVKATEQIVSSWNKAHPDIHVNYQKVDPNSVHDKLVTQFAGNSAPDIIHDEAADIAGFSQQGYLADLTSLIPSNLKQNVPDSVWQSVTYDNKITGIPTIAQVYNVFVNTKALKKAGVALPTERNPWTWDDLMANAKKLTKGNGTYGFAWGLKSPTSGLMSSSLACGAKFVSGTSNPTMTIGKAEMQVPNDVRKMLQDKTMAPNSTSLGGSDVLPGFFGGKYPMIMAGNYVATQIDQKAPQGFDWTMIPLIKCKTQDQMSDPQTLSVARQSKHPKEAMQFIAYFMKAENLAKIAEGDSLIPVSKPAAAIMKKDLSGKNGWNVILDSAGDLVDAPWNKTTRYPEWKSDIATPAYQEFLSGKIDAATLKKRLTQGWANAKH